MSERDSSPPKAAPATSPSKRGGGRGGFTLSLKGRALRLLTGREHSRAELERKLAPHEEEAGQLAKVLDDLQAKDFISEHRVIESVVNRRASRFGAARIRHELQGKGLQAEAVAAAVQSLKATEVERAREVWRKKFGAPAASATERGKQAKPSVAWSLAQTKTEQGKGMDPRHREDDGQAALRC
jgi:regulatory protein